MLSEGKICEIEKLIIEDPELRNPLDFHLRILEAQRHLRMDPGKGTTIDWSDKTVINRLEQQALETNKPIADFIDVSAFIADTIVPACETLIDKLSETGLKGEPLNDFLHGISKGSIDISDAVGAALKGDAGFFERYGEKFGIDPSLLLFTISSSIQPCLEEIAGRVSQSFLDSWWHAPCPVCGRIPFIARLKSGKRYLKCTFCSSEYLADIYMCANCGNGDPGSLKFLAPEDYPEFRVDFCEKCKHYLKVIDKNKLRKHIPEGLEDIMTINLDLIAINAGLVRV